VAPGAPGGRGEDRSAGTGRTVRRIPWVAIAVTALVLVSAPFAAPSVRDAVTLGPVEDARLALSNAYLALAPVSAVLDTITLVTLAQRVSLLAWAVVLYGVWRLVAKRRPRSAAARVSGGGGGAGAGTGAGIGSGIGSGIGAGAELKALAAFLACVAIVCAAAAWLPRPMARLYLTAPDAFAVDFRVETQYGPAGRSGWTPDDARTWARAAGFDAAYVADTRTLEGADRARAVNPVAAGLGTVLLPALAVDYRGEQVLLLDAGRLYKGLTNEELTEIDEQKLTIAGFFRNQEPVLVETMPGTLTDVVPAHGPTTTGVRAIELVDGSTGGLAQTRRDRSRIIEFADSLNLALVSATDHGGSGRAAPAWTVLRFGLWREMSPDSLGAAIDEIIRGGGRRATEVVERNVAGGSTLITAALAPVLVPWRMLATLSGGERVAWIVWAWASAAALTGVRKRRASTGPPARARTR